MNYGTSSRSLMKKPRTNYDQWTDDQKKFVNLDGKAMNALIYALNKE